MMCVLSWSFNLVGAGSSERLRSMVCCFLMLNTTGVEDGHVALTLWVCNSHERTSARTGQREGRILVHTALASRITFHPMQRARTVYMCHCLYVPLAALSSTITANDQPTARSSPARPFGLTPQQPPPPATRFLPTYGPWIFGSTVIGSSTSLRLPSCCGSDLPPHSSPSSHCCLSRTVEHLKGFQAPRAVLRQRPERVSSPPR